jgi:hypothetical protein
MRKFIWLFVVCGGIASASPAHAASIFAEYFAHVISDVSSGPPPISTVFPPSEPRSLSPKPSSRHSIMICQLPEKLTS